MVITFLENQVWKDVSQVGKSLYYFSLHKKRVYNCIALSCFSNRHQEKDSRRPWLDDHSGKSFITVIFMD